MRKQLGVMLIALGLMVLLLFFMQAATQGNASFGGVVLIGPIPIVFGSSPQMAIASMLLAIILIALSFLILVWPKSMSGEEDDRYVQKTHEEGRQEGERTTKIKGGMVVMIGPIPLVVGSDPRTAMLMMLIAMAIMIAWALIMLR